MTMTRWTSLNPETALKQRNWVDKKRSIGQPERQAEHAKSGETHKKSDSRATKQQKSLENARQALQEETGTNSDEELKMITSQLNPQEDVLLATRNYLKLRKSLGANTANSTFGQVLANRGTWDNNPKNSIDEFLELYKSEGTCGDAMASLKTINSCQLPDSQRALAIRDYKTLRAKEGPWQSDQTRDHFKELKSSSLGGQLDSFITVLDASGGRASAMDDYGTILRSKRSDETQGEVTHNFNRLLKAKGTRSCALEAFSHLEQAISPSVSRTQLTQAYLGQSDWAEWPSFLC